MDFLSCVPGYIALRRGNARSVATWRSLAIAILFFAMFDVALVCQWGWTTWWAATTLGACWLWCSFTLAWLVLSLLATSLYRQSASKQSVGTIDSLFADAMGHYLRGNWFETEAVLQAILRCHPHDAESLLFYATLLRRTQRLDEASEQLRRLTLLDAACLWRTEISAEETKLSQQLQQQQNGEVATFALRAA